MKETIMASEKKKKVIKKNQNLDQKVAAKTARKTAQKATQKEVLSSTSKPKRKVFKKAIEDINFENAAFRYDDGRSGVDYNAIMKSICTVFVIVIVIVAVFIFMFIRDDRNKKNNLYLGGYNFIENIREKNSFYNNYNNKKIGISIEEETETKSIIIPEIETTKKTNKETKKQAEIVSKETSKEIVKETEKETEKETMCEVIKETEAETKKLSETQKKEIKIEDAKDEASESIKESIKETTKKSVQEKETKVRKLKPEEVLPNFTKVLYSEAALLPYTATEVKSLYTAFKGYAESDAYKKLSDDNKYLVAANMKFIDNYVNTYKAEDRDNYLKTDASKYLDIIKKTEASILKDDGKFYYRLLPLALAMDKVVDRGYYYEIPTTTYSYVGAEKELVTLSNEKVYIYKNARIGYGDTLSSLAKNYLMYPEQINYELYACVADVCKKTANNPNLLFDALVSQQQVFDSNGFIISLINIDEKG